MMRKTSASKNQASRLRYDEGGSSMFGRAYFSLCQLHSVPVITDILTPPLESHHHLYLDVDKVKRDEDWSPILKALKATRDLKHIYVFSNGHGKVHGNEVVTGGQKAKKIQQSQVLLRSKKGTHRFSDENHTPSIVHRILPNLMLSLKECLVLNKNITKLEIAGIPLRDTTLNTLAKGLHDNKTIQNLSLARTEIGDKGLILLAPSLRTILYLSSLNLSACDITYHGVAVVTSLFKSLAVRRQSDKWAWSLRNSDMIEDEDSDLLNGPKKVPRPLQRLNLSVNPIGDEGFRTLVDLIQEEIGLLALDIQRTQLSNISGKLALDVFRNNQELLILDMRNNNIDDKLLYGILDALSKNDDRRQAVQDEGVPSKLVWLDGQNPIQDTYHFATATMRAKMQTHSSIKKKKDVRTLMESKIIGAKNHSPVRKTFSTKKPVKSIIRNSPKRNQAFVMLDTGKTDLDGISFYQYKGHKESLDRPTLSSIIGSIENHSLVTANTAQAVYTPEPPQPLNHPNVSRESWVPHSNDSQKLLEENAKLKERIDALEEALQSVLQSKRFEPGTATEEPQKVSLPKAIKEEPSVEPLELIKLQGEKRYDLIDMANPSEEHIDTLIHLMEHSLASFHEMLDSLTQK